MAEATGILMVRYQLTHDQARAALDARAERAQVAPRVEAERIITSQDTSVRRWATGPATGVLDRQRLQPHT